MLSYGGEIGGTAATSLRMIPVQPRQGRTLRRYPAAVGDFRLVADSMAGATRVGFQIRS
jgi:hypothetical protein